MKLSGALRAFRYVVRTPFAETFSATQHGGDDVIAAAEALERRIDKKADGRVIDEWIQSSDKRSEALERRVEALERRSNGYDEDLAGIFNVSEPAIRRRVEALEAKFQTFADGKWVVPAPPSDGMAYTPGWDDAPPSGTTNSANSKPCGCVVAAGFITPCAKHWADEAARVSVDEGNEIDRSMHPPSGTHVCPDGYPCPIHDADWIKENKEENERDDEWKKDRPQWTREATADHEPKASTPPPAASEPRTTHYCAKCGCSPEAAEHGPFEGSHKYVPAAPEARRWTLHVLKRGDDDFSSTHLVRDNEARANGPGGCAVGPEPWVAYQEVPVIELTPAVEAALDGDCDLIGAHVSGHGKPRVCLDCYRAAVDEWHDALRGPGGKG